MTNEQKQCHLGFIQGVITRMAANSFLLRGWSITLVAAIFSLAANDSDSRIIIVSYFSVLFFWSIDAYYIRQEKLYRKLYEEVAHDRFPSDRYSLDTAAVDLLIPSVRDIFIAKNTIAFHLPIVLTVTASMIFFLVAR